MILVGVDNIIITRTELVQRTKILDWFRKSWNSAINKQKKMVH